MCFIFSSSRENTFTIFLTDLMVYLGRVLSLLESPVRDNRCSDELQYLP